MNFLDFLKQTDDKRRRTKRLAIKLLYFLTPIVILAASFTNDRIIAECEEIHQECQERIRQLQNSGEPSDTRELEALREENRNLRAALANQPEPPPPPPTGDDSDKLAGRIADLELELRRCEVTKRELEDQLERLASRGRPAGGSLDQCESEKEELRAQRDECQQEQGRLREEIERLVTVLEECRGQTRRRTTPSSNPEDILRGSTFIGEREIPKTQRNLIQGIPQGEAYKLMVNQQVVAYFVSNR